MPARKWRLFSVFVIWAFAFITLPLSVFAAEAQIDPQSFIVRWKEKTPETILAERQSANSIQNAWSDWVLYRNQPAPHTLASQIVAVNAELGVSSTQTILGETIQVIELAQPGKVDAAIAAYKDNPLVASVQPNYRYYAITTPNDTLFPRQWNLGKIQAEQAWDVTRGNAQVKVAVLDTGITSNHEELGTGIVRGGCFATHGSMESPACARENANSPTTYSYSCTNDEAGTTDDNAPPCGYGHGTQMTGIIKASLNNGRGLAGIAPDVTIIAIKVLDKYGGGNTATVAQGVNKAISMGANIISMSLGGPAGNGDDVLRTALNSASSQNITVFAAAGNACQDASREYPSGDPNVITVGATGPNDERAVYSNFGTTVDVGAPGGNPGGTCTNVNGNAQLFLNDCSEATCIIAPAISCASGNQSCYIAGAGTSQAAPHAAAVAALLLSKNSSLSSDTIRAILTDQNNTDPITTEQNKPIGRRLNANKALHDSRVNTGGVTPTLTPTPPGNVTPTITLTPPAGASPTVTPIVTVSPFPTNQTGITYIYGNVTNLAQGQDLTGLTIALSMVKKGEETVAFQSEPVNLGSTGEFLITFTPTSTALIGQSVSVQLAVKNALGKVVRESPVRAGVIIGRETRSLNFPLYYCQTKFSGDANCDGRVDRKDYTLWKTEFRDSQTSPLVVGRADFNGDNRVDLDDYLIFLGKNL